MGKFDGYLIVSDIDGTFLDSESKLVPANLEAIKYFESEGGRFTFASGRMHSNLIRVIPEPEKVINAPAILTNGTYYYDFSRGVAMDPIYLDGARALEAMRYLRKNYPETGVRVSVSSGFLIDIRTDRIDRDLFTKYMNDVVQLPMSEWEGRENDWYKIVVRDSYEVLELIRADFERLYSDVFECSKSERELLELQHKGCNKAIRMVELKHKLEQETGRKITLCACGDYENDLQMLKAADISGCPSNAIDMVKDIATVSLCSSSEGFIAEFIYWLEKRV